MTGQNWMLAGTLLVFNASTITLLVSTLKQVSMKDAVKDKGDTQPTAEVMAAKATAMATLLEIVSRLEAAAEKLAAAPAASPAPARAGNVAAPASAAAAAVAQAAAAVAPAVKAAAEDLTVTDTSYSRVSGMIGAVVMATFFWGIGNVVLYRAIKDPVGLDVFISSLATFFLGGASLFLPYAFNQAKEAFAPKKP